MPTATILSFLERKDVADFSLFHFNLKQLDNFQMFAGNNSK